MAAKFGDPSLEAKSKHSKNNSNKVSRNSATSSEGNTSNSATSAEKSIKQVPPNSAKGEGKNKSEFIAVMKSRGKGQFWSNDVDAAPPAARPDVDAEADESKSATDSDDGSHADADTDSSSDESEEVAAPAKASSMSDLDYLRAKVSSTMSSSDSEDDGNNSTIEESEQPRNRKEAPAKLTKPQKTGAKKVAESPVQQEGGDNEEVKSDGDDEVDESRLFVRNLPFSCSEEEITELFKVYGPITQVHIPLSDTGDGRGKGFGFVQFMIPEHASKAMAALDGTPFQGRLLHIIPANKAVEKATEDATTVGSGPRLSAYQQKKEEKRRKLATLKEGWNAAHIRSDAVIDATAEKYVLQNIFLLNLNFIIFFKIRNVESRYIGYIRG